MTRKTGLLGGAFNPPHYGHLQSAREVMTALGLERVLFIPSGRHPFKGADVLAPVAHRVAMVRLALEGEPGLDLWEIEAQAPTVSYTIETLAAWHRCHPDEEPVLLLGADILGELHLWRAWQDLLALAHVAVMTRPGFFWDARLPACAYLEHHLVTTGAQLDRNRLGRYGVCQVAVTPLEIASTELRRRLRVGQSVSGLTPEVVGIYAHTHQLFSSQLLE
ncbi:MAG: nicotinate (nicotinamide) nucleotide adenylyltransferase [Magnetococcales bacterium]|nr:nicotinate (nicotinamide) nucleotide adenylyltransferase [Magnetococcales bacterium]NGZ07498.1 nicotinate (nicotinamide) nucleotide adenylyltransferase [Magnetococcales bacterium]